MINNIMQIYDVEDDIFGDDFTVNNMEYTHNGKDCFCKCKILYDDKEICLEYPYLSISKIENNIYYCEINNELNNLLEDIDDKINKLLISMYNENSFINKHCDKTYIDYLSLTRDIDGKKYIKIFYDENISVKRNINHMNELNVGDVVKIATYISDCYILPKYPISFMKQTILNINKNIIMSSYSNSNLTADTSIGTPQKNTTHNSSNSNDIDHNSSNSNDIDHNVDNSDGDTSDDDISDDDNVHVGGNDVVKVVTGKKDDLECDKCHKVFKLKGWLVKHKLKCL